MIRHIPPPRRRYVLPAVIGLGLMAAGCATAPYQDSVGLDAEEQAELPPNGAAAALRRVAMATRAAGDYASAINVLKRAHGLAPNDEDILLELGESLAAVGAYNEAREMMVKAVTLKPADTRALRGLGNALLALSEPALAVTRYRAALKLHPEAATYNGLAIALDMLGDGDGADRAYRDGLALEPENTGLIGNFGLSLALRGKTSEAINRIAPEIRLGRSTPQLRQNLALVYGLAGRNAAARTILRIDLDERAVRNNIAYYEMLRGLPKDRRRETVLGRRHVVASRETATAEPAAKPVTRENKTEQKSGDAAPVPGAQ